MKKKTKNENQHTIISKMQTKNTRASKNCISVSEKSSLNPTCSGSCTLQQRMHHNYCCKMAGEYIKPQKNKQTLHSSYRTLTTTTNMAVQPALSTHTHTSKHFALPTPIAS
uniref:Uncharacterized protein n=1 Tax=Bactrocera dorsalis TaxID=27457 RepID=A0A034WPH7_BACDO